MTLNQKDLAGALGAVLNQIKVRVDSPFYKAFPDSGTYSRDNYPLHMDFIKSTDEFSIVYMKGANRTGKTFLIAYMVAVFMTGLYPHWWMGRKFDHAVNVWLVGVDHIQMRDALQELLLNSAFSTGDGGLIPKEHIIGEPTHKAKPPGAVLDIRVRHVSGKTSTATFHCHEQGASHFQGAKRDVIVFDEEPPMDIFGECTVRLASGKADGELGLALIAATPLKGRTAFIRAFRDELKLPPEKRIRKFIEMSWNDAPHMSEEEKNLLAQMIPAHELEARSKGIEYLGAGLVFQGNPSQYTKKPFDVSSFPRHFKYLNGLDTGSITFALFSARDTVLNKIKIFAELEFVNTIIPIKAKALSQISIAPYLADTSGKEINEADGKMFNRYYTDEGLTFHYPNKKLKRTYIDKVNFMLQSGQLEISSACVKLLESMSDCQKNMDGVITSDYDHPIDALLYLIQGYDKGYDLTKEEIKGNYNTLISNELEWRFRDWQPGDDNEGIDDYV